MLNFMKIRADRLTDRTKLIVAFRNFAKAAILEIQRK